MPTDTSRERLPNYWRETPRRAPRATARLSAWDLGKSQLLAGADTEVLMCLLEACPIHSLHAGDALLSPGQSNSNLYLILEGRVRTHQGAGDSATSVVLRAGEMVCDLSVIDNKAATVRAVAETASCVLAIDRPVFWTLVEASHAVARNVLTLLSEGLRRGNIAAARAERLRQACERNRLSAA